MSIKSKLYDFMTPCQLISWISKFMVLIFFFSFSFHGMQSVGNRVGVTEPFLMRMAHGAPVRSSNRFRENLKPLHGKYESGPGMNNNTVLQDDQILRVCKRFYVALILSRLVQVSSFFFLSLTIEDFLHVFLIYCLIGTHTQRHCPSFWHAFTFI